MGITNTILGGKEYCKSDKFAAGNFLIGNDAFYSLESGEILDELGAEFYI